MNKDLGVIIKTIADVSGLSKLGSALMAHSATLGVLGAAVAKVTQLIKAGLRLAYKALTAELHAVRNAALGAGAALAASVREGVKFNLALVPAVNMFGGNRLANFIRFRQEINTLSSELGIAKGELTKALYMGGSAQMSPADTFTAIRKAAQGAIADGAELQDVFGGIVAAVKSFGGDVNQSAEQLYRIVQLGQTNFAEVGQYLSQVGPVAAANNVSLGETGAAIATLTAKTIPLSQSVNMLRNMMSKLNMELGDGWHKTRTFQEAMEEVAKRDNYSQVKLSEAFGLENLAGVNALVGESFAKAKADLLEFKGELTGLAAAGDFAAQFTGWQRIWQTIHGFVVDIGSEIERRWQPRIQLIAEKLNALRTGEGFKGFVDAISGGLEKALTSILAAAAAAKALAADVKALWQQDSDKALEFVKGRLIGLVELAARAFVEFIHAHMSVFMGMVKVLAAAFKEEIIAGLQNIPILKGKIDEAARDKWATMSDRQRKMMADDFGYKTWRQMAASPEFNNGSMNAKILGYGARRELESAWSGMVDNLKDAAGRVGEAANKWMADTRTAAEGAGLRDPAAVYGNAVSEMDAAAAAKERQQQERDALVDELKRVNEALLNVKSGADAQGLIEQRLVTQTKLSALGNGLTPEKEDELARSASTAVEDAYRREAIAQANKTLEQEQADVVAIEQKRDAFKSPIARKSFEPQLTKERADVAAAEAVVKSLQDADIHGVERELKLATGALDSLFSSMMVLVTQIRSKADQAERATREAEY